MAPGCASEMRILLTAHRFWPHVGGTEEVVERLAESFAKRGHEVTVATSAEPGAAESETRSGFTVRRFALRRAGKFRFPPLAYRDFVLQPGWDVAHLHGQRVWSTDYLYRHLAKSPAPVVFTAHGFYQYHMEKARLVNDTYYHLLLPRALRATAAVTALTESEKRELAGWGVPAERVRVIPDGLDLGEFEKLPEGFRARHGFSKDEPLLLYVGGFYPNKRVDRLVDVASRANARLVVIGKDQDASRGQAYCERLARKLGARVTFLGLTPREDVLAAFRECTLFTLASDFEGFGLVLLEAMAAGLPWVATPAGAAPDLARLGGGAVAQDTEEFAHVVSALLADADKRAEMGARGRDAARSLTWDAIAGQYLALYEEVRRR